MSGRFDKDKKIEYKLQNLINGQSLVERYAKNSVSFN